MEFRPGNHEVVHHAVVLVDAARSTRHLDALDPEPGWAGMQAGLAESPDGHFLGWTPGKTSLEVPEGMTWRLPRGSDLVLQLHLLPQPDAAPVQVQVGFHFGAAPSRTSTRLRLGTKAMDVPAGEASYRIRDAYLLPVDVELVGLYPHAHYLGREMRAWAEFEDGGRHSLLHIPTGTSTGRPSTASRGRCPCRRVRGSRWSSPTTTRRTTPGTRTIRPAGCSTAPSPRTRWGTSGSRWSPGGKRTSRR